MSFSGFSSLPEGKKESSSFPAQWGLLPWKRRKDEHKYGWND